MLKLWTGCAALCLTIASLGAPAFGQERSVEDRLERVERDLNQLQRQVYRNEVGGAPAPVTPAGSSGGQAALDVQIRMDQIESQMRTLTGKIEENEYNLSQLSNKLDKIQSDNEVRFQQLESGGGQGAAPAAKGRRSDNGAGDMSQPASASGVLTAPDEADGSAQQAQPAAAVPDAGLPVGTVQQQYNYAFGLLRQADYKGAETAFKAFLKKHPGDPLAANAQYWLGETYFVRGDYAGAAAAFADGYQKYPQGPKAADNLLKLGMSLGNEGRKQDACFSFARLERDFPTLAPALKQREASEKKRFGC